MFTLPDTASLELKPKPKARTDNYYAVSSRIGIKLRGENSLEYKTIEEESELLPGLTKWPKAHGDPSN